MRGMCDVPSLRDRMSVGPALRDTLLADLVASATVMVIMNTIRYRGIHLNAVLLACLRARMTLSHRNSI